MSGPLKLVPPLFTIMNQLIQRTSVIDCINSPYMTAEKCNVRSKDKGEGLLDSGDDGGMFRSLGM